MTITLDLNKEGIELIAQAFAEVNYHNNIRKRHGAFGRFDISQHLNAIGAPLPQDERDELDDHNEATGKTALKDQQIIATVKALKEQLIQTSRGKAIHGPIITNINGKIIEAVDYAVKWCGLDKSTQDSTHEITCFDKDSEFLWVSGMMDNQIARIRASDPTDQHFFRFPEEGGKGVQPHTLRFDSSGALWVGLEYAGKIVKLKNLHVCRTDSNVTYLSKKHNYELELDVRIQANGSSIPYPINTHPHGFCFDRDEKYIWFTGKLTNTVGRVLICEHLKVQHFELPTLGAVPIYVALGPDNNIWGTCLTNNNVFRVTTGDNPIVTEIPITAASDNRRPIAIKAAPNDEPYMWFSTEAGHTVARIDCHQVQQFVDSMKGEGGETRCTCSKIFYASSDIEKAITEFVVPRPGPDMLMAGLAFDMEGNLWTQSYVDSGAPASAAGPDYIVRIDKAIRTAQKNKSGKGRLTGIPFEFYELPTRGTILHRIIRGPGGKIWFTELGADRVGKVTVHSTHMHGETNML